MAEHPVDIWKVSLAEVRNFTLSPDESARAARFHFERDRERWSRARSALREILARYTNAPAASLTFRTGEHGKPSLESAPEIQFNLSHSGAWAIVAVSPGPTVGVDIETIRDNVDIARLLRRVGEPDTLAPLAELFHRWTRREARTKAVGSPLFQPPPASVIAADLEAPEGYAASVALEGFTPSPNLRYDIAHGL